MTRLEYRKMLKLNGPTQRDRIINKSIHDQNKLAPVSPSFKDVTIDDIPRKLNIISSTVMDQKIIHTLPGEDFSIGSIVYWSKSHWLITERDPEDEITVRGRIQICRKEIKWQDDNSHKIHSLWAIITKDTSEFIYVRDDLSIQKVAPRTLCFDNIPAANEAINQNDATYAGQTVMIRGKDDKYEPWVVQQSAESGRFFVEPFQTQSTNFQWTEF